jgi:RimJ/RimL family protein N-acetyltransferase
MRATGSATISSITSPPPASGSGGNGSTRSPTGKGSGISKSSDIAIRRLHPGDAAAYRELRLRGLALHPDAFTSSHEEDSRKPIEALAGRLAPDGDEAVYGAFADGRLVALAGLARERRMKNRHKATVFGMFVAPEHAGRGIGRALLAHVIGESRRQPGLEQLVLTVTDGNAAAAALYASAGFRSFGIEPRAIRVDGTYFAKNHMILLLDPP